MMLMMMMMMRTTTTTTMTTTTTTTMMMMMMTMIVIYSYAAISSDTFPYLWVRHIQCFFWLRGIGRRREDSTVQSRSTNFLNFFVPKCSTFPNFLATDHQHGWWKNSNGRNDMFFLALHFRNLGLVKFHS